ncbi:MAG: ParB/RepB/Spo0J family partition protein [Nakamurella sp.]
MTTATKNPPTIPADPEHVITLTAAQVAQHPANLRDPGRDIDRLAASIAEVGVLVPLIVVPVGQVPGQWPKKVTHVAVDGNRRQAAAAKTGAVLPCLVRPGVAEAQATARTMAVTGLMRDGLTVVEEARAVQTMLDLGISQTAIGKATGRSRSYVRNAQVAATVDEALSVAADGYALTLDQLAELAAFTDDQDATSRLLDSAYEPGEWAHTLTYERQQREAAAAITAARDDLTGRGVTVLDEQGDYDRRVGSLLHDGEPITDHSGCPGHSVHIGFRHGDGIHLTDYCADPIGNGHTSRYGGSSSRPDRANETPEQAEARKTERRDLIRLNRVADAAQEVRRQFLRDQLASKSKTQQKAMTEWALLQILSRDYFVTSWLADRSKVSAHPLDEILGSEQPTGVATSAPVSRQPIMLWAYAVAAHEDTYHRDSHRQADASRAGYVRHLLDLGYTPAETDRLVMGERILAVDADE